MPLFSSNMDYNVSFTSFAFSKTDMLDCVRSARMLCSQLKAPHQDPRFDTICRYDFSTYLSIYMSTSFSS